MRSAKTARFAYLRGDTAERTSVGDKIMSLHAAQCDCDMLRKLVMNIRRAPIGSLLKRKDRDEEATSSPPSRPRPVKNPASRRKPWKGRSDVHPVQVR